MIGYETQARATRQKIVRLRDLRLPREAKARFDGCYLNFARVRAYDLKLRYTKGQADLRLAIPSVKTTLNEYLPMPSAASV